VDSPGPLKAEWISASRTDLVRACGDQGIAFVPFYSVAASGGQRGVREAERQEVVAIARAHGVTAAQIRIAWTLHQGPHVLAIPGTGNPDHLTANVAAGALRLSDAEVAILAAAHRGGPATARATMPG
jgi:pyridoxine 4-dehydrogenase